MTGREWPVISAREDAGLAHVGRLDRRLPNVRVCGFPAPSRARWRRGWRTTMTSSAPKWTRETWPIAAAMIQYPNMLPDGRSVQDQTVEEWALTVGEVADAGFTEIDPTDSW